MPSLQDLQQPVNLDGWYPFLTPDQTLRLNKEVEAQVESMKLLARRGDVEPLLQRLLMLAQSQ